MARLALLCFYALSLDSSQRLGRFPAPETVVDRRSPWSTWMRVLGKKTLENEILKEAVEYAAEKKWIARSPLLPGDGQ